MMQRFKIINQHGKVLRDFKTPDRPEVWARFLKHNEYLLLADGRTYGRLLFVFVFICINNLLDFNYFVVPFYYCW